MSFRVRLFTLFSLFLCAQAEYENKVLDNILLQKNGPNFSAAFSYILNPINVKYHHALTELLSENDLGVSDPEDLSNIAQYPKQMKRIAVLLKGMSKKIQFYKLCGQKYSEDVEVSVAGSIEHVDQKSLHKPDIIDTEVIETDKLEVSKLSPNLDDENKVDRMDMIASRDESSILKVEPATPEELKEILEEAIADYPELYNSIQDIVISYPTNNTIVDNLFAFSAVAQSKELYDLLIHFTALG